MKNEYTYQLLARLQSDCNAYLSGAMTAAQMWANDPAAQIAKMRELYAALPEKPKWLTPADIDDYAREMLFRRIPGVEYVAGSRRGYIPVRARGLHGVPEPIPAPETLGRQINARRAARYLLSRGCTHWMRASGQTRSNDYCFDYYPGFVAATSGKEVG